MPVKTKIVEVEKPVLVPLDKQLTTREPHPATPAMNCVVDGVVTFCNRELADWLLQYRAALTRINDRVGAIDALQPKGAK